MWLERVLKEAEATAVSHEPNLHFRLFFLKKSFRLVSASFWDLRFSFCIGVSGLIALRSGLRDCLMLMCAWVFIKGCT